MGSFQGVINIQHNPILLSERYSMVIPKRDTSPNAFTSFSKLQYSTRAEGNFYRCTFKLHATPDYLNLFFRNGLMRHVTVDSPKGKRLWEGFIYEMTLQLPRCKKRISVQSIADKVWVRYQLIGSGVVSRTTPISNSISLSRYGIREAVMTSGETNSSTEADQLSNRILEQSRIPKVMTDDISIGASIQESDIVLTIVCYGYYETLKWQCYNQTAITGTQSATAQISDVIAAKVQFYKSTDLRTNSTPVPRVYDMDRSAESIIKSIAALGDAYYRRWLIRYMPGLVLAFREAAPPDYPPV
jgi:hypothetical protein